MCAFVETEYKRLMEREAFYHLMARIRAAFPDAPVKDAVQVNYYYDTADGLLQAQDITLRIRQTQEGLWLQSKAHFSGPEAYRRSQERRCVIDSVPDSLKLKGFPGQGFFRQGSLVTHRTRCARQVGLRLDFDVNFYEGIIDFELEAEFRPDALEQSRRLLESFGLSELPSGDGKATRFFAARAREIQRAAEMDLGFAGRPAAGEDIGQPVRKAGRMPEKEEDRNDAG